MVVLRFHLTPDDLYTQLPELRFAYFAGLDRTPEWLQIEFTPGLMTCRRAGQESGRYYVPWPIAQVGLPYVGTATLAARDEPYELPVELSRGKLTDVRSQAAEWQQLGLVLSESVTEPLESARQAFSRAVTAAPRSDRVTEFSEIALNKAHEAAHSLVETYTEQLMEIRRETSAKLPTLFACGLNADPTQGNWSEELPGAFNAVRLSCTWAELAPSEGRYDWERFDAQIAWCRSRNLLPMAGPLLEFRPESLPEWLWLWSGDQESLTTMALEFVQEAVKRYQGRLATWHLAGRPGSGELLGLSEENQVQLTARALRLAHQIDPVTPLVVDLDRPWGVSTALSSSQLDPLQLADLLSRADLGLAGIGLEIAIGAGPPGSHLRDLLEFSRLLDLYNTLNKPIYVILSIPSNSTNDPNGLPEAKIDPRQWPNELDDQFQRRIVADWVSLAVAKRYVRAVIWQHATDHGPHLYHHAGLFHEDQTPKPVLDWLRQFRRSYLV